MTGEWTPERIAEHREAWSDTVTVSMLDEIERLQARVAELDADLRSIVAATAGMDECDQRREVLLRDALDELQSALSTEARHVAARIRTEIGDER